MSAREDVIVIAGPLGGPGITACIDERESSVSGAAFERFDA